MADPGFHTTSTSTNHNTNIRFDSGYVKTLPGMIKITQIVLNLLGFICIEVSGYSFHSRGSWFNTVAMGGFWFTGIMLAFYLFHVLEKFYKIPWLKIELVFCALWTLFYLLAACLAATFGLEAYAAASFFGFCAMIAYGYDAYLKFRAVQAGRLEQGVKVVSKEITSPVTA
ncbi:plasmolipin-like [Arctopsyche grandis]|uniref:plasmolipin-like n=1 Tax=Arctopsyche grandis TaxID=121162 RepID=UPI00406D83FF